ncbi:alanine dehydrogenase [Lujinxingia litoralis]|uniref:Alanine dehydrogenase n=1 Tax=Lujinxingia litoralis TaxID=2211119 RepID=A0A328C8F4_9DELT|nr:alanine dehydrogenase [Lujinxingia litoralis]RAL22950.1 alanine dehydrogenase [Lujinxingia litoralis]
MHIGVPKEIKNHEYRVGLVPAGVAEYVRHGHRVVVEAGAGEGSAISDERYVEAGATIVPTAEEVWASAEMIVKVKEPVAPEYELMKKGQLIYTYFHLAAVPELARVLLEREVSAVAYETIQLPDGRLPLLEPMSEVAGRMAIQVGARCLEREYGGKGVLLGGVPGVARGKVVILGGGVVGTHAAKMAVGMGAQVTIIDLNLNRLRYLDDIFGSEIQTMHSNVGTIAEQVLHADLVVGAVLIPGARAPRLVTREHISQMQEGSVVVDVSVDQGGCIATCHPTTHADPTYVVDGVVHYCVANMPGAVARTSTFALNNTTLRYGLALANKGLEQAVREDAALALGVNTYQGACVYKAVADDLNLEYTPLRELL